MSGDGKRLHRLTFSKTMADFVASYGDYVVGKFKISRGRQLAPGEESTSGVYLVCTAQCGSPLRATLIRGIAEVFYDEDNRLIYEGVLQPKP